MLRSGSTPHFIFLLSYFFFQSHDLERHLTFSHDLRHMVDHLTSHLTFIT